MQTRLVYRLASRFHDGFPKWFRRSFGITSDCQTPAEWRSFHGDLKQKLTPPVALPAAHTHTAVDYRVGCFSFVVLIGCWFILRRRTDLMRPWQSIPHFLGIFFFSFYHFVLHFLFIYYIPPPRLVSVSFPFSSSSSSSSSSSFCWLFSQFIRYGRKTHNKTHPKKSQRKWFDFSPI